jgi:hypothetical protein
MLTRRLKGLVDSGLLKRHRYSKKAPRYEYVLTERGRDFRSVILALLASPRSGTTRCARRDARPGRRRLILSRPPKTASQRLVLGDRSAAVRRALLSRVFLARYSTPDELGVFATVGVVHPGEYL